MHESDVNCNEKREEVEGEGKKEDILAFALNAGTHAG